MKKEDYVKDELERRQVEIKETLLKLKREQLELLTIYLFKHIDDFNKIPEEKLDTLIDVIKCVVS